MGLPARQVRRLLSSDGSLFFRRIVKPNDGLSPFLMNGAWSSAILWRSILAVRWLLSSTGNLFLPAQLQAERRLIAGACDLDRDQRSRALFLEEWVGGLQQKRFEARSHLR